MDKLIARINNAANSVESIIFFLAVLVCASVGALYAYLRFRRLEADLVVQIKSFNSNFFLKDRLFFREVRAKRGASGAGFSGDVPRHPVPGASLAQGDQVLRSACPHRGNFKTADVFPGGHGRRRHIGVAFDLRFRLDPASGRARGTLNRKEIKWATESRV